MRRRWLVLGLGGCVVAVWAIWVWSGPSEPRYEGKKLSEWLGTAYYGDPANTVRAVRQIGTNALPWLLKWVRYEDPALPAMIKGAVDRPKDRLRKPSYMAQNGFAILRESAKPAAPELARLLGDRSLSRSVRVNSLLCLRHVEGPMAAAVQAALTDPDPFVRAWATNLGLARTNQTR